MTSAKGRDDRRRRGSVRRRGGSLQVRVFAGQDPVTGRDRYLTETVKGVDDAAQRRSEKAMTRLQADVDRQRSATTALPVGRVLDEWLRTTELEESTRRTYVGYVERTIKPAVGSMPVDKLGARHLETLAAELRRCRRRCDGKPFVERHRSKVEHDCGEKQCVVHSCTPMGASTIRQIHSIISGALSLAVRWEWIATNVAKVAQRPRAKAPEPAPPSTQDAAYLLDVAFGMDIEWGTLVWLVMTTGIRRGELCALRWRDIDLDAEVIDIRRNYVLHRGVGKEKDTKTHQMRRIALDSETVTLLREQKARVRARVEQLGGTFTEQHFVFGGVHSPDHSAPYSPHAVSSRYTSMAKRQGIDTHIHALRHYSATELLTAGVDLRTVAGRLGHGGGGATTLKVYAAWVAASDRKAAELMGSRMPRRPRTDPTASLPIDSHRLRQTRRAPDCNR